MRKEGILIIAFSCLWNVKHKRTMQIKIVWPDFKMEL